MSSEKQSLFERITRALRDLVTPAYAQGKSYVVSQTGVDYTKDDFGNDVIMIELRDDTTFNVLEMDNVKDIDNQQVSTVYNTSLKKSDDKVIYGHVTKVNIASGGPVRLIKER